LDALLGTLSRLVGRAPPRSAPKALLIWWPEGRRAGAEFRRGSASSRRIDTEYGDFTAVVSAFGKGVLDSHHMVLTVSLARIFRLVTHSAGDGRREGLCQ
jgi:hypothetical protein